MCTEYSVGQKGAKIESGLDGFETTGQEGFEV